MSRIKLTNGFIALVDKKDYLFVSKHSWYAVKKGNTHYAARFHNRKVIYMHRELLNVSLIDHKNGNGLDNRRLNLRESNKSTNAMNSNKRKNTSTPYKGVYKSKEKGRRKVYQAYIDVNQKRFRLGWFYTAEEAAKAYNTAAIKYHKEFARLNLL